MPYEFDSSKMYRMPTHFGPRTGPRRGPNGERFENVDTPKSTSFSVSFLSDEQQLEAYFAARIRAGGRTGGDGQRHLHDRN